MDASSSESGRPTRRPDAADALLDVDLDAPPGGRATLAHVSSRRGVGLRRGLPGLVAVAMVLLAACVPPCGPPVGPAISMDPTLAGGFFSMPWPNDVRTAPDGSLDLSSLPGVELLPGEAATPMRSRFPGIIAEIGRSLEGFGTNSAIYFVAEHGLAAGSVPSPSGSVDAGSTVMLMDLDHPGERVPIIVDWQPVGDRNRPDDIVTVLPYPGHPLRPSTRYAVTLFDGVRTNQGEVPAPSPLLARLDAPWTTDSGVDAATWDELRSQRDLVRSTVASTTTWRTDQLLAFTVFTTQDVQHDMEAVAAAIAAAPAPTVQVLHQGTCSPDPNLLGASSSRITGTVDLTRWQTGTYPYLEAGGEIEVGVSGRAVAQGTFAANFTASIPCGPAPAQGWPLATFIDGTGGGPDIGSSILPLTHEGFVLAQTAPVYGQGRGVTLTPLMISLGVTNASEFAFYNFLNPDAARTNTIQQTAENLELLDAMETLTVSGASVGTVGTVGIDPEIEVAAGQSQGAQTLSMVAAMRPSLDGVVASAGSGGLYHTISHNSGNRQFLGLLTGDAQSLDELNPVVQIAQTMLEGGDGINYPNDTNFLKYSGVSDTCVPFENSRYFAGATGLPIHYAMWPESAYGDEGIDPPVASLPAQGNVEGRTRVSLELPGGHFVAYDQKPVTAAFLAAIAGGTTPVVPASGYYFGLYSAMACPGGGRWDVPATRFAR